MKTGENVQEGDESCQSRFLQKSGGDLKLSKPGQWYYCLKRITSHDQQRNEQLNVDHINHLTDQQQAEIMASLLFTR